MISTVKADDIDKHGSPVPRDDKARLIEKHIKRLTMQRRKTSTTKAAEMKKSFIEEKIKTHQEKEEEEQK
jgi:hypothetical protein